jgi:hypothetical protein
MKRSEMISKMLQVASQYRGYFVDDIRVITHLIDTIEEAGMLPPRHPDYEGSLDIFPRGYEWEPEDENS